MIHALWRTARPKQWVKNVLVFAAPGPRACSTTRATLGLTLLAFVAFCLAASGSYFWNDVLDVEADRAHPAKRFRPIAAGLVPLATARIVGTMLVVAGLGVAAGTGRWQTVAVVAVYVVTTMAYSAWLKHVAVVDLVTVASGFVLRAAAGAVAVDVPMSSWFVLCTVFGSMFIVTGKRYAELREMGDGAAGDAVDARRLHHRVPPHHVDGGVRRGARDLLPVGVRDQGAVRSGRSVLRIVDRADAHRAAALRARARAGSRRRAGGGLRHDRVLQLLGAAWVLVFGLGVYLRMTDRRRGVDRGRRESTAGCRPTRGDGCTRRPRPARPGRPDRRDRQLPGAVDDRARAGPRRRASRSWPSIPTPGTTAVRRRSRASPTRRPATAVVFAANLEAAGVGDRVRHVAEVSAAAHGDGRRRRSTCSTSTAPTATARRGPTSATGARVSPTAARC